MTYTILRSSTPEEKKNPDPSMNPSPDAALPLHIFAGTYTNPSYGNLTLCHPGDTSPECIQTLSDFASFEDIHARDDRLYASQSRLWSTHIRFASRRLKVGGNARRFDMLPTWLFPEGYGENKTPFEMLTIEDGSDAPEVEFVLDESGKNVVGFGLFDLIGKTERQRLDPEGSVEERADVWYTKV